MAWYNKYRPQDFNDVVGQDLVKKILQNAISKDRIRHAYLFAGSKGVGKTTLARIFAGNLNDTQTNPDANIDIIEMDAASNTGIDDIRNLIDSAKIPPLSGKHKVFIIDEVHMLSKPAMNALLKILEEPPHYLVFLLATTNPEKLLPTIHSRLTLLRLHDHSIEQITSRLRFIADAEGVAISDAGLELIAHSGDGSQRDSINLLETVSSYELDSYKDSDVAGILGLVNEQLLKNIHVALSQLTQGSNPDWSAILENLAQAGTDPASLLNQLTEYALKISFSGDTSLNAIIPHLIDIQAKRIPLTSNIALFGLIHALVVPVQHSLNSAPSSSPTPPKPTSVPTPIQATASEKQGNTVDTESPARNDVIADNSDPLPESEITPSPAHQHVETPPAIEQSPSQSNPAPNTGTSSASKVDAIKAIQMLFKSKDCQPMLKMMSGDIEIESVEGNVVSISVTNGIFETQLKTSAMTKYLADHFNSTLGFSPSIQIVPRTGSKALEIGSPSELVQTEPTQVFVDDSDPEPIQTQSASANQEPTKSDTKAGDIFYSVFKELPKEMEPGTMPVFEGQIPTPPAKGENDSDDWDSQAETMFEFE